jgi:hypothetical protein
MLSSFIKKLLFARQFFMIDGKIEVLGKRQVMLPAEMVDELQKTAKADTLKILVRKNIEDYAKKLGSGEEGLLKNISDIFETYGLGKLEIVDLDNANKKCLVRIQNLSSEGKSMILEIVLGGIFSFLFKKEVKAEATKCTKIVCEYVIK